MTKTNMDLSELLAKHDQGDFLRGIAEAVLQRIMEADVEGLIGAGRHERSGERTTWRNGYRERALDTRLGTLNLRVPKLRQGSYFPGFLEARKTSEQALVAVIQEAWIGGVSTRRVDELVQAMGLSGISKSTVSKLCKDIDERVGEFLNRPLTGEWPYVWLDATYLKVRQGGRIVPVAAIIAVAANTEGRREIIGLGIGPSEAETFWTEFLRSLRARGLGGVRLVISDAPGGAAFGALVVGILNAHQGLPLITLIFAALLGLGGYVLRETTFGLYLYAVGNNDEAARRSRIKVATIKMAAFGIAGGIAALGGIIAASRTLGVGVFSGGGVGGGTLLLESIAATVIGGVSLFGGRGSIHAALLGALVIGTVQNGLNLMNVENEIRLIVTGLLLVLAVSIDKIIEKATGQQSF